MSVVVAGCTRPANGSLVSRNPVSPWGLGFLPAGSCHCSSSCCFSCRTSMSFPAPFGMSWSCFEPLSFCSQGQCCSNTFMNQQLESIFPCTRMQLQFDCGHPRNLPGALLGPAVEQAKEPASPKELTQATKSASLIREAGNRKAWALHCN